MYTLGFRAMGSQMLAVLDSTSTTHRQRLQRIPAAFAVWERRLSRFQADSELSQLNATAGQPQQVSRTLWSVVDAALAAAQQTDGLVSPALLTALEQAGYDRSFDELRSGAVLPAAGTLGRTTDWRAIRRDPQRRSIQLAPELRLDLGGIAKGWAADYSANWLGRLAPALVDAGGDIAISGRRSDGSAWPIGVANPFDPQANLALLLIPTGGIATSGRDYRRWQQGERWQHHIIDPRTQRPADSDLMSVTVIGPSAQLAEVAAKAVLILGSAAGLRWIEARPELAALLVCADQRVLYSQRLQEYLYQEWS